MENNILVSIITVVYNGEKYLKQTIESVLNQTYSNIEYIIVDGGSKDNTLNIIKSYENKIQKWVSEPDQGLYDAMNKGIAMASGDLIGMINSDDWYELNAVETIIKHYRKNPTKKIIHGDRFNVLENGERKIKKFHPSNFKFLYYGMTYNHPSVFVTKDIYKAYNYNTKLRSLSDFEFILKQYLINKENLSYIPHAYVNYRLDGISSTINYSQTIKEGFIARKNAGLSLLQNLVAVAVRTVGAIKAKASA